MNHFWLECLIFLYIIDKPNLITNYKKRFFTEPTIVKIFDTTKDLVLQYKVEPSPEQIVNTLRQTEGDDDPTLLDSVYMLWKNKDELAKTSKDWIENTASYWGKYRSFYTSLENTIAYVQSIPSQMKFDEAEKYINKASEIFNRGIYFNTIENQGHDFFDPTSHVILDEDTHTSGYPFMDACLNGGFTKKGLHVLMGPPKVGKSMWLCNLAANSVKNGYHTIYISLEMSYQLVSQRIGSNLFNIDIDNYKDIAKTNGELQKYMLQFNMDSIKPRGELIIEEFPTSTATANDIEAFILKKEQELSIKYGKPFKFKNVFIDYLNIMRNQKGNNSENSYQKIKDICEDTRAVAQRNQWAIVSLTQTNRSGMENADTDMTNVAESAGLVATVDSLFGIIQTTIMKSMGIYYLKAVALRNSKYMSYKKKYNFDGHHLRITEDPTEGMLDGEVTLPKSYSSVTAQKVEQMRQNNNTPVMPTNYNDQLILSNGLKQAETKMQDLQNLNPIYEAFGL